MRVLNSLAGFMGMVLAIIRIAHPACLTLPMMQGQDPQVAFKDGYYHLVQSDGCNIHLRRAKSLSGLVAAGDTVIYSPGCANVWAPELHWLSDRWYIYYSMDTGSAGNERVHVAQSSGSNPNGPYTERGVLFNGFWNIDGSVFTAPNGQLYFLCSGRTNGPQNLYIAPMSSPVRLSAGLTLISTPSQSWEFNGAVNEGPYGFVRNGRVYIVYSGSGCWTDDYSLGLLTLTGQDPLKASSWTKSGPVFAQQVGAYGPGHNCVLQDANGLWWNIYHANNLAGQGCGGFRQLRAERFIWNADNTPFFGRPVPVGSIVSDDPDFLVCALPLDATAGTSASVEGCGPAGKLKGAPVWKNPGLKLNGRTDYVEVSAKIGNDVQSALTLAAWIRADAFSDWAGLITKGTNASPYAMQVWGDGSLQFTANWGALPGGVGSGSWKSSLKMSPNRWYHVAVTSNGSGVRFYINGQLDASRPAAALRFGTVNEPITIGADLPGGDEYFNGTIREARIYGRALNDAEIGNLATANRPPLLVPIGSQELMPGQTLTVTNSASDPDVPPQILSFRMLSGPASATLNPTNGVFQWRPRMADAASKVPISIAVSDDGSPSLSATQTFEVNVLSPAVPQLSWSRQAGGMFHWNVSGDAGPDYSLYAATNLSPPGWTLLYTTNAPIMPFEFTETLPLNFSQRYYRVLLGP